MSAMDLEPHVLLGAHILGALSDRDERAFLDHLGTCLPCQEELQRNGDLRRLLDLVDPGRGRHARGPLNPPAAGHLSAQRRPVIFIGPSRICRSNR